MAGAQAAPPARAATRRHGATRTVSIAAHVETLHPHHDGRPCRQRVAPGHPGRRQCGAADRLRPTRPVVPARPPADHTAFRCAPYARRPPHTPPPPPHHPPPPPAPPPPPPPPPPYPHRQRPPPADRGTNGPSSTGHAEMFDSHQTFATTAPYSWFTL